MVRSQAGKGVLALLEALGDHVYIVDLVQKRLVYASEHAADHHNLADVAPDGRWDPTSGALDMDPADAQKFREMFRSPPGEYGEITYRRANGGEDRWRVARMRFEFEGDRAVRAHVLTSDVTELVRNEQAARAQARRAETLLRLAERLRAEASVEDTMRAVCEEVARSLGVSESIVYLFDDTSGIATATYSHGVPEGVVRKPIARAAVDAFRASVGDVAHTPDVTKAPRIPNYDYLVANDIRSVAAAPLLDGPRSVGVLTAASVGFVRELSHDDLALLKGIADLASSVLSQARLQTAKSLAEHELRASEGRFREMVESLSEGILVVDAQARFAFANGAYEQMLGYDPGELVGKMFDVVLFPNEAEAARAQWSTLMAEPGRSRRVQRLRAKDGREVWASSGGTRLTDELGNVVGRLAVVTDITDARRLEQKLLHAQKLESLGVLAGGVAHDFNNLLVGILGNAGLALMEIPPESSARSTIEMIQSAAIRASELTKQLLAYAGKGRFVVGALDVGRLVVEMQHLLGAMIPKNTIVKYSLTKDLPAVEADATQIRQVVMNLITNAAEAIGDAPGVITLGTNKIDADAGYLASADLGDELAPGVYACLEVSDTGCGMSYETRAKIFDPFFTTKFTGRGLGLAAVQGIMRAHRGAVKVYSEVGRGTTFKLLLPAAAGAVVAPSKAPVASSDWRGAGAVLVVDDEASVRNVMKRILEQVGFEVITAKDGVEGVEAFRVHRDKIRAVLLDVTMPNMGGEEAYRQLRALDPTVTVVLSSGYSEDEAMSRFAGKGLAAFLEKPFKPAELITRLREAIEGPIPK